MDRFRMHSGEAEPTEPSYGLGLGSEDTVINQRQYSGLRTHTLGTHFPISFLTRSLLLSIPHHVPRTVICGLGLWIQEQWGFNLS